MVRAKRKISGAPNRQRVSLQCSPGRAAYSHRGSSLRSTSYSYQCASPASFMRRTCGRRVGGIKGRVGVASTGAVRLKHKLIQ